MLLRSGIRLGWPASPGPKLVSQAGALSWIQVSADLFVVLLLPSLGGSAIIACVIISQTPPATGTSPRPLSTSYHVCSALLVEFISFPQLRRYRYYNYKTTRASIDRSIHPKFVSIGLLELTSASLLSMAPHRHGSSPSAACTFLMMMLLLCRRAGAIEYKVGDKDFGWDSGINYAAWVREHTFAVGDVLVFQYVSSQHNAYEVTESTYRSCDAAGDNGVLVKHTTGFDKVVLAEARTYRFICEFPGHCLGGMKHAVNVSAPAGGPSPNAAPPLPPTGSSSAAASLAGGCRGCWLAVGLALGVLVELMNWATR